VKNLAHDPVYAGPAMKYVLDELPVIAQLIVHDRIAS